MTTGGGLGSALHTLDSHNGTHLELKYRLMRTIAMAETGQEKGERHGKIKRQTKEIHGPR